MSSHYIPQIMPWLDEDEVTEVTAVLRSTYISEGKKTALFEEKFREFTGAKYALACANATCGLFTALKALGIGPGDEVIVPDLTFVATANVVIMTGATPIFCDVDPVTFMITPELIEPHITEKTKAIMPVHLYGQPADLDTLIPFAKEKGLILLEDAAQGVGTLYKGKHVGTFGALGVFAFYANKIMTTGEGGLVLTNDEELMKKSLALKNHGRTEKGTFWHPYVGMNFKFTDVQAAIGLAQFKKLPTIIEKKAAIFNAYKDALADVSEVAFPTLVPDSRPVFWFSNIIVPEPKPLMEFLHTKSIGTREFFPPLHKQPCFDAELTNGSFPNADTIYAHGVSLPSYVQLEDKDIDYIATSIREFYRS